MAAIEGLGIMITKVWVHPRMAEHGGMVVVTPTADAGPSPQQMTAPAPPTPEDYARQGEADPLEPPSAFPSFGGGSITGPPPPPPLEPGS